MPVRWSGADGGFGAVIVAGRGRPPLQMAIPPRSTTRGESGEEPCMASHRLSPGTAPAPRGWGQQVSDPDFEHLKCEPPPWSPSETRGVPRTPASHLTMLKFRFLYLRCSRSLRSVTRNSSNYSCSVPQRPSVFPNSCPAASHSPEARYSVGGCDDGLAYVIVDPPKCA